ncbi:MAG: VOC family protein [Candidatus Aminicenantes bacterium]|nr:VOC family protein [Candidatus Aminicenantes bacterium]
MKKISHLGMAVKDLGESREFYETVLGLKTSEPIVGGGGALRVSMIKVGQVHIELLQPADSQGVMAKFLEKRGEGFHHICYEVDDIYAEIDKLKKAGMEILGEVMDGVEGPSVFIHPRGTHGVLVELVEKKD